MTATDRGCSDHTARLFGLSLDALTMDEVVARCRTAVRTRTRLLVGVLNAAKVVKLRSDPLLSDSLLDCDVRVADGQAVVWASRLVRHPLPERVAGIDLFTNLLAEGNEHRWSVFLLGARPEVLERVVQRVQVEYPDLLIAGHRDGYFTEDQGAEVAAEIRRSGADLLFLGMTSPKKEIFLSRFGDELAVPVLHGVGGSFDILAGITRRAPVTWQRLGLEWAYRLKEEPRRMWRRYLVTNTKFIAMTVREAVRPYPPLRRTTDR